MALPEVEIEPGDTLQKAEERVERTFEAVGLELVAFESLNTSLPCSDVCHFFHVESDDAPSVVVVCVERWSEETVITVLNVLLELRMDPEPPGSRLRVRFASAYAVPDVLELLFGDALISDLECRAALVARFGHELEPSDCTQFAAAATQLGRSHFGVEISIIDPQGVERLIELVCDHLRPAAPPGEPLNALIVLGCLLGELLRSAVGRPTRWARNRQFDPWPGLLISLAPEDVPAGEASPVRSDDAAGARADEAAAESRSHPGRVGRESGAPSLTFHPIAHVIQLYRSGDREGLRRVWREIIERSR